MSHRKSDWLEKLHWGWLVGTGVVVCLYGVYASIQDEITLPGGGRYGQSVNNNYSLQGRSAVVAARGVLGCGVGVILMGIGKGLRSWRLMSIGALVLLAGMVTMWLGPLFV